MQSKRRKYQRARTAPHHKSCIEERISFGEDAKQQLRNMSLINNISYRENNQAPWTKQQDNLSFKSFGCEEEPKIQLRKNAKVKGTEKKDNPKTRNSSPIISATCKIDIKRVSKANKKELVPFNVNLNDTILEQRIHTTTQRHNLVNQQLRLFNEVIFRKTAAKLNRTYRASTKQKNEEGSYDKSHRSLNYLEFNFKYGCKKILPLKVTHNPGMRSQSVPNDVLNNPLQERLKQNKANIVRRLIKEQRKNNFNESLFAKRQIKPQF